MTDELLPEITDEILDLIQRGEKLKAIKRYKEERNVSLADAKRFIEQIVIQIRSESLGSNAASNIGHEIVEMICSGQKIRAVKLYREQHGTSLMDAKLAVEQITDELKAKSPEKFPKSSATGCAATAVLLATSLLTAALGLFCVKILP